MAHDFASDNHAPAHPEILAAIGRANEGHAPSYGADEWTARAEALFRRHFGDDARAFLVFNGSGANVACIDAVLQPHEAVICAETAHLHVDECGAPERIAGAKLLTVPTADGKLTPDDLGALGGPPGRRALVPGPARLDLPGHRARHRLYARGDPGI